MTVSGATELVLSGLSIFSKRFFFGWYRVERRLDEIEVVLDKIDKGLSTLSEEHRERLCESTPPSP